MEKEKLFREFPPVSTQGWKDQITKDLKGADYKKKLFWQTGEGFAMAPFYREEDVEKLPLKNVLPGNFPFVRGNSTGGNNWLVSEVIVVDNIRQANAKALDVEQKGVGSLAFVFKPGEQPSERETEELLKNLSAGLMEFNFRTANPAKMVQIVDRLAKKHKRDPEKVRGSVFCDPLSGYSLSGRFKTSRETGFAMMGNALKAAAHLPRFHTITVDGSIFHNAGSGTVSEMAFTLSMAVEYLNYLTDKMHGPDDIAQHIRFNFAVGGNYFMEIAKFRALRYLWAKIVNAYGINDENSAKMYIHCSSSIWNKTMFDPYVNMLRTTTETMSAGIGGVDSMTVLPFDEIFEKPTEMAGRIARNQQLILKGESYFDKVADPAAGSYYIENLTQKLANEAWNLFLEVDERGGYLKAFEQGFIQQRVTEEARKKDMEIAVRKRLIVGINRYPNAAEQLNIIDNAVVKEQNGTNVLRPCRAALPFEKLRLKTNEFAQNNGRPEVWMFTFGKRSMRRARAQFAADFFGCAGFQLTDNNGFATVEEGIAAAKKARPNIVVMCSSDEDYAENALNIFNALKDKMIVVLAGYPEDLIDSLKTGGIENFIHTKSNVPEELNKYLKLLNID
ncbi:MAG: methylmalonyl-CoA mutase family protein [Bacteroidales bacterium]|nr:methylmalonyl-CoA mutase family protein [Bacteroidales bacterium]